MEKANKQTLAVDTLCGRYSIYNKELRTSWKEHVSVYLNTKLAKPITLEPKHVYTVIYGNTIEQIKDNIGSTNFNWSTHVNIDTYDVSSEENVCICWEKDHIKYYFDCELMHVWTYEQGENRYYKARYNAISMYTLDSYGNVHFLAKDDGKFDR